VIILYTIYIAGYNEPDPEPKADRRIPFGAVTVTVAVEVTVAVTYQGNRQTQIKLKKQRSITKPVAERWTPS
jgi:hypothetical protein